MGVSTSPLQFAQKCQAAAAGMALASQAATRAAAARTKETILSVSPRRLRNVGRGAALGVGYEVFGSGVDSHAVVRARGPWQIIENDIKPHEIVPNRAQVLAWGDQFAASVSHPGTRGQAPFHKGAALAVPQLPPIFAAAEREALTRIF